MSDEITTETLTDSQINTVRERAVAANDLSLVAQCDAALRGQFMARQVVIGELQPKRRMR